MSGKIEGAFDTSRGSQPLGNGKAIKMDKEIARERIGTWLRPFARFWVACRKNEQEKGMEDMPYCRVCYNPTFTSTFCATCLKGYERNPKGFCRKNYLCRYCLDDEVAPGHCENRCAIFHGR